MAEKIEANILNIAPSICQISQIANAVIPIIAIMIRVPHKISATKCHPVYSESEIAAPPIPNTSEITFQIKSKNSCIFLK